MNRPPETHYATSGEVQIAYQAFGEGPDLVWVPGWVSQLDLRAPNRVLATVLFTDLVGSTGRVAELGDSRWRALLGEHNEVVRRVLARYGGREVDRAGDGFLATFDGPGRAVRCALAIVSELASLQLDVRVGVHTGEVEIIGEGIGGIAVHIGARVAGLGSAGDVLVTRTVKDLTVGSGIEFQGRGTHLLRGVPGDWELFAARVTEAAG